MLNRLLVVIIFFVITHTYGCKRSIEMNVSEYLSSFKTNKLKDTKVRILNRIKYKCKIQPPDLITITNSEKKITNQSAFELERLNYEKQLNFILVIEDESMADVKIKRVINNKNEFNRLLAYANNLLQNDFSLQLNNEVSFCKLIHLEPANSIYPSIRVTLTFNELKSYTEGCTLVFNDNLFNNGLIKFSYEKDYFENLPKIKI